MKKEEAMEKGLSLVDRSTIAMLATYGAGYPDIRAMIKNENEGLKTIWFTTNTSSKKREQLKKNPKVCVYFVDFDKWMGLKLIGTIDILQDPASKQRLWREGFERYYPLGECRNSQGNPGTDILFTGQRLDGTGLYYYGARYYDASIGRFISADTIVQSPGNPQTLNRYSYCLNNPLAYIDPTGNIVEIPNEAAAIEFSIWNLEFRLEVPSWVMEWAYLRCAWDQFREKQPVLAGMLEQSEGVFTFKGMVELPGHSNRSVLETLGQVLFDAIGRVRSSPNTLLGLKLATMTGSASLRFGPGGTLVFEGIDTSSTTGKLMDVLNARAFTVGYVIITKDPTIDPDLLEHELGHVTQAAILGPAYLPSYGIGWLLGGWLKHSLNIMESWLLPTRPRR